jgi:PAS domain S-box-containing protein
MSSDGHSESPGPRSVEQAGRIEQGLTLEEAETILLRLAGTFASPAPERAELSPPVRSPHLPGSIPPTQADLAPIASQSAPHNAQLPFGHLLKEDASRILLEALPDALLIVNGDGHIVLANAQAEKLFGYEHDALLGQPIELLVPEQFREMHVAHRTDYAKAPYARPMGAELELSARRKDMSAIPVEISLSPLQTNEGMLVVATIRDICGRRQAEAQLRKMEARYRALVEEIPAVTFVAALDEGVNELFVSPQIEALLGFSQQEWLDNPVLWYRQLHPDDRERWSIEFAHTCATGEPFQSIYRLVARDGRVIWVRGEAKLLRDDQGRPVCLQGIAFDLTAIKEAEEEVKALNRTLEQRVAERTAIAEHRAHELERSNAALEQFGYIIAHDLRQPLRTIKSYTQRLTDRHLGKHDAATDDSLTRTSNAADRMRVLIDDLLAYSRVSTQGKDPVSADCGPAVAAACGNLQAEIEDCEVQITCDAMPTVMADGTQVAQLFQNLIGNALKFRADRSPRIHVSARRDAEQWLISVADNGIGIEPQYLERIFGLGERLHSIAKYSGNGIGLATCQKIVQRHGGQIRAESPGLGQGSTFTFTLPATP